MPLQPVCPALLLIAFTMYHSPAQAQEAWVQIQNDDAFFENQIVTSLVDLCSFSVKVGAYDVSDSTFLESEVVLEFEDKARNTYTCTATTAPRFPHFTFVSLFPCVSTNLYPRWNLIIDFLTAMADEEPEIATKAPESDAQEQQPTEGEKISGIPGDTKPDQGAASMGVRGLFKV